jgi:hypothetical protein
MSLAQPITNGARIAIKRLGVAIPEIEIAQGTLDELYDRHFGINSATFDVVLDLTRPLESDLQGLGPRILDIKNRGGRTAEDSWFAEVHGIRRARRGGRLQMRGAIAADGAKRVKPGKDLFPAGAKRVVGGVLQNVGGQSKGYQGGAAVKSDLDTLPAGGMTPAAREQYGVRWSKAALELAFSHSGKRIHFHLDGMGDISVVTDKSGDYAYNVTARELRYVYRHWQRFQSHVIFYNGYSPSGHAVIVEPPWLAEWQANDVAANCPHCGESFNPVRWKHHCRGCGQVFCDKCCAQTKRLAWPVKEPGKPRETEPVRLCADCFPQF